MVSRNYREHLMSTSRLSPALRFGKFGLGLVLAASSLILGGCVEKVVDRPVRGEELVTVAPPPPQVEVVGVAPHPGWVWQPGYWNWAGGRHVWVAGNWVEPREGYRWEPHAWVREGKGWRLREGAWVKM
jgi:hypothetical protein